MKTKLLRKLRERMICEEWWNTYDKKLYIVHPTPLILCDCYTVSKFPTINGKIIMLEMLGFLRYKFYMHLMKRPSKITLFEYKCGGGSIFANGTLFFSDEN